MNNLTCALHLSYDRLNFILFLYLGGAPIYRDKEVANFVIHMYNMLYMLIVLAGSILGKIPNLPRRTKVRDFLYDAENVAR